MYIYISLRIKDLKGEGFEGPMILRDIYNMNLYKTIIYIMYYIYIYIHRY